MAVPDSLAFIGVGAQTAKGVGAAATFGSGVTGGKIVEFPVDQGTIQLTTANPGFSEVERRSIKPGGIINTLAYARLAGLFLKAILGSDTVTGVTPKLHTIVPANDPIPYLTLAAQFGTGDFAKVLDTKIDQLEFDFTTAGAVTMIATIMGTQIFFNQGSRAPADVVTTNASTSITSAAGALFTQADVGRVISGTGIPAATTIVSVTPAVAPATNSSAVISAAATASGTITATIAPWAPVNDETAQPYFSSAGGTFLMDTGSTTPIAAKIKSGKVIIKRNLDPYLLVSNQFPDDVIAGQPEVMYELTIIPTDLSQLYRFITASSTGVTPSTTPTIGSVDLLFTFDANTSLEFISNRVTFKCEWPDAKPLGGAAELIMMGDAYRPAGGNMVTALVRNTVASY